jgi:WD40 repeat protein
MEKPLISGSGEADPWELGGELKIWDVATGAARSEFKGDNAAVMGIAFAPDGESFAVSGQDDPVKIRDARNGSVLFTLQDKSPVRSLAYSPAWLHFSDRQRR